MVRKYSMARIYFFAYLHFERLTAGFKLIFKTSGIFFLARTYLLFLFHFFLNGRGYYGT